jgi:uncharacterized membrane protein
MKARISARILEMDATRGAAMIAVMLAHSSQYLDPGYGALRSALKTLGMIATPTFLLLSGVVCGHLITAETRDYARARSRLVDRGLFLLLVAHLVLGLTHAMWEPAAIAIGGSFYITDAVGLGLIATALIGRRATSAQMLCWGLASLVVGWLITFNVDAQGETQRNVLRFLVGLTENEDYDEGWIVPIVPYLGIFSIGFAGGVHLTRARARGVPMRAAALQCLAWGGVLMAVAMACKLAWIVAKPHVPASSQYLWFQLTEPRQKMPPGPTYVLWFGGAGAALAGIVAVAAASRTCHRTIQTLATIGRTSLFIYLLQYWLISVPALRYGWRGDAPLWAGTTTAAILVVILSSRAWDSVGGNRLLTLGLRNILTWNAPRTRV